MHLLNKKASKNSAMKNKMLLSGKNFYAYESSSTENAMLLHDKNGGEY